MEQTLCIPITSIRFFTYVKNKEFELRKLEHTVSGMLLYAQTDENVIPNNTYQMSGNTDFRACIEFKSGFFLELPKI